MLFNLARARLAKETREGAQAILNTHPQHWSRAWFRLGSNCDSVDNNICESFNKWIIEARFFPIITMLETIRRKVMVRIQEQRTKLEKWTTVICPNINKKLNVYISLSANCHAICNGEDKYEVKHFDNRFTVDLVAKTCSCRYWQLAGLPCCHAISCILFKTNCLDAYVADCYSVQHFKRTYTHCLNPVEGMNNWPVSDRIPLRAPGYVKMPGRPKTERRREPTEARKATKMPKTGTIIRCSKCHCTGHNRTTCDKINGARTSQAGNTHAVNSEGGGSQSVAGGTSQPTGSQSAAGGNPDAMVVLSNTQKSSTSCTKRRSTSDVSSSQSQKKVCLPTSQSFNLCSFYLKLILPLCRQRQQTHRKSSNRVHMPGFQQFLLAQLQLTCKPECPLPMLILVLMYT
jgi:hypothetical protein